MLSRRDLITLCLGLPLLLASWAAFVYFSRDDLDQQLRSLAGPQATDCGVLPRGGLIDTSVMQQCAVRAFVSKQPFFYRVPSAPIAGRPLNSVGTVMTPKKEMFLLTAQEPTWDNWQGHVTAKIRLYNPRITTAADESLTITFDRTAKPKQKKPALKTASPAKSQSATPSKRASAESSSKKSRSGIPADITETKKKNR